MKKSFFSLLVLLLLFLSISPSQTFAASPAEGNPNCQCTSPDSLAGGANGFKCSPSANIPNPGFCSPNFYCQNGTNGSSPTCKAGGDNIINSCISLNGDCGSKVIGNASCCGTDTVCETTDNKCVPKTSSLASPPPPPPPPCANPAATNGCDSVNTAFGVWSTQPGGFVTTLFGILLGLSGGIAVFIIMLSGYRILVSHGDPEKVATARETLTAAIVGLLFLIFSLVILQVIGVDLLHLPQFGA